MTPHTHVVLVVAALVAVAPSAAAQDRPMPVPLPELSEQVEDPQAVLAVMRTVKRMVGEGRLAEAMQRRDGAQRGPELTEPFSRTVPLGRSDTFELVNPTGNVVVTGTGGDEVQIEATKRVRHPDEAQARSLLQAIRIDVSERSGLVNVRTAMPRMRGWSGSVDYTISLPEGADVVLRTVSGNLRITNIRGDLQANAVGGNIEASDLGRVRMLRSVSGDVRITNATGDDVTVGTVSGNVVLGELEARSVSVDSVGGDVRLSDVEIGRLRLRSLNGNIEFEGPLAQGGRYEMQSHSGDILIRASGNTGFDLEANSFSGDLRSDYDLQTSTDTNAEARQRQGPNRTLRGTFGNAGAVLTLRSFSGNITITQRP